MRKINLFGLLAIISLAGGCSYVNEKASPSMGDVFFDRTWQEDSATNRYAASTKEEVDQKWDLRKSDTQEYKNALLVKINQYLSAHPDVNNNIKQSLLNLKVCEGMNKEEVKLLLDYEIKVTPTDKYGADEVWVFQPIKGVNGKIWYLYFKGDILIKFYVRHLYSGG